MLGYFQQSRPCRDSCFCCALSMGENGLHFALSAATWGAAVWRRWLRNFHTPYKIPAPIKPRYIHMMVVLQPAR
jgi:hypothetical protein